MIDTRKTLFPYLVCAVLLCSLPITWTSQYAWVGAVLSGLILVFGLPHGAYDIFLLRARFGRQRVLRAASVYLLTALCVPLIWWVSPTAFLLLFLGLSIVHFGDSDWPEETWPAKLAWGILVLAIPVTLQPGEVRALFAMFAPASLSAQVVQSLTMLLIPAGFTLLTQRKTFGLKLLALLLLAALCLRTSALVGFAVYFCLFHSRSHLLRWRVRVPVRETRMAGMLVVGVLLGVVALVFSNSAPEPLAAFDVRVVAITFLVLASLTVPHMITVALANRFLLERSSIARPPLQAICSGRSQVPASDN